MVMTLDGTLLAYATAHDADIWDYGNYDTVLRRSTDGGKTWSPMEVLFDGGKSTVDNCVLIVDPKRKGVVHHLYCVDYAHTFYRRSTDHARTFSPAIEITQPFAAFAAEYKFIMQATGPGHGVQLDSGSAARAGLVFAQQAAVPFGRQRDLQRRSWRYVEPGANYRPLRRSADAPDGRRRRPVERRAGDDEHPERGRRPSPSRGFESQRRDGLDSPEVRCRNCGNRSVSAVCWPCRGTSPGGRRVAVFESGQRRADG